MDPGGPWWAPVGPGGTGARPFNVLEQGRVVRRKLDKTGRARNTFLNDLSALKGGEAKLLLNIYLFVETILIVGELFVLCGRRVRD